MIKISIPEEKSHTSYIACNYIPIAISMLLATLDGNDDIEICYILVNLDLLP